MIDIFNQRNKFLNKKSNFLNAEGISKYLQVPDWNSMSCEELPIEIQKFKDAWIEVYLKYAEAVGYTGSETAVFDEQLLFKEAEDEYKKELENAETIYSTKCTTTFVDEVVPRDIAPNPEAKTETQPKPEYVPIRTTALSTNQSGDGGGGGGAELCQCPNTKFSNLGLILIGLGTLILVYNNKS